MSKKHRPIVNTAPKELEVAKEEKSETSVWHNFSKMWPYYCERNDGSTGFPDVVLLDRNGAPGFIELKRPDKIELRNTQWAWHSNWKRNSGKSLMVSADNVGGRIMFLCYHILVDVRRLQPIKVAGQQYLIPTCAAGVIANELGLRL